MKVFKVVGASVLALSAASALSPLSSDAMEFDAMAKLSAIEAGLGHAVTRTLSPDESVDLEAPSAMAVAESCIDELPSVSALSLDDVNAVRSAREMLDIAQGMDEEGGGEPGPRR